MDSIFEVLKSWPPARIKSINAYEKALYITIVNLLITEYEKRAFRDKSRFIVLPQGKLCW